MVSWVGLMKIVAIIGISFIMLWVVYSNIFCFGLFVFGIGMLLIWHGLNYLQKEFNPDVR